MVARRLSLVVGFVVLMGVASGDLPAGDLPVSVSPDDENIRYVGRFTQDHRFAWTGSSIRLRFEGAAVTARMKLVEGEVVTVLPIVDGKPGEMIVLKKGTEQTEFPIASGLPAGEHTVELFKSSEAGTGAVQFLGFSLSEGAKLLAVPQKTRKILALGDSITCAFGSENRKDVSMAENENGYLSHVAVTARAFDADVMMICSSGWGLYRSRDIGARDKQNTIPTVFDRILLGDLQSKYDHTRFVPDVVVINLGTNDNDTRNKAKTPLKKEDYLAAYNTFLKRIRTFAPNAQILVAIGPMTTKPIDGWLAELAAGDEKIHAVVYHKTWDWKQKYMGGVFHPNNAGQQLMADVLIPAVAEVAGWESDLPAKPEPTGKNAK